MKFNEAVDWLEKNDKESTTYEKIGMWVGAFAHRKSWKNKLKSIFLMKNITNFLDEENDLKNHIGSNFDGNSPAVMFADVTGCPFIYEPSGDDKIAEDWEVTFVDKDCYPRWK